MISEAKGKKRTLKKHFKKEKKKKKKTPPSCNSHGGQSLKYEGFEEKEKRVRLSPPPPPPHPLKIFFSLLQLRNFFSIKHRGCSPGWSEVATEKGQRDHRKRQRGGSPRWEKALAMCLHGESKASSATLEASSERTAPGAPPGRSVYLRS